MTFTRPAAAVLLTTFALFAPARAEEPQAASVSGKLVIVDGDTKREIPLRHAYARYIAAGPPGPGETGVREEGSIEVLLSEEPLPEDWYEREKYVAVRSKEGRFRGLRLKLPGHDLVDVRAYCDGCVEEGDMLPFVESWSWSASSLLTPLGATLSVDRKRNVLSGEIAMYRPVEAGDKDTGEHALRFDVKFAVPIETADGYDMPPADPAIARAYESFRAAVVAGDPAAIRGHVAAEYAASFDGPGAKERIAILQSILDGFVQIDFSTKPGTSVLAQGIRKVPLAPPAVEPDRPGPSSNVPRAQQLAYLREHRPAGALDSRFVEEGNAWKVFWVLDRHHSNVLAPGYRTPAALLDEIAERERREADEYFAVEGGKPLPPDGGAAGAAYMAFTRAERAADKRALVKFLLDDNLAFYSHPKTTIRPGFTIWKRPGTSAVQVVGGEANAEEATLRVAGTVGGAKVSGRVKLFLDAGQWKVDSEDWN
jgi:hypothetical protein